MDLIYKIDPQLNIPLYQQLVDMIRNAIKKGTLPAGHQLPTVQEMTEELGIARGTIKRAYDELELAGLVEKIQGRGTFVCYQPANSDSRKEQAMAAIDHMLNQLEQMGLSPAEVNIFLNLKLRDRAAQEAQLKVAVVECTPETLSQMTDQLRHTEGIDTYSFLLENIQQYPYQLGEDYDLIVTTSSHAEFLESVLPVKKRIARVALRLTPSSLAPVIKLTPGSRLGVLSYSPRFGQLLRRSCLDFAEDCPVAEPLIVAPGQELLSYLRDKDAVVVPDAYERYFNQEAVEQLRSFTGTVIPCHYEMDEGSVLYLQTKVKRLLEEKTI